ncbi:MAG: beta-lactamase family protein [Bacteroidetes bacterium]|nr:beta-lactamase family protein [Bacteroidota bacterium]
MKSLLCCSSALWLLLSSCSSNEAQKATKDTVAIDSTPILRKLIDADRKAYQLDTHFAKLAATNNFSGSVLIAQRGVVLFHKAYGWANVSRHDSLTLSSGIQLASVSKQFTAAAIMLLQQEKKLNYDDPLQRWFPDSIFSGITIRHLLTHRSGLPTYTYFCDDYYREQKRVPAYFNNDSMLALMRKLKPSPDHRPNEKFDYNNTGYVLLAMVVEKISGQSFAGFMHTRFFKPLGMKNTWVNTDTSRLNNRALAYFRKWEHWEDNYFDNVTGDKGVISTPEDLFIWDRALKQHKILTKETLQLAFTGASPELKGKETWNYGFGWRIRTFDDGARAVFHNGWWHGYTTAFYRGISDDVTVIILCNKVNKSIYRVDPVLAMLGAHYLPWQTDEGTEGGDTTPKK